MYGLLERGNFEKSAPPIRFHLEAGPPSSGLVRSSPRRRLAPTSSVLLCRTGLTPPFAVDGLTARFFTATLPEETENHFDAGDLALPIVNIRLEPAFRAGCSTELTDSLMPSFPKAALGSFSGIFRGQWRSSLRRVGP